MYKKKILSEEHKKKISASNKGKHRTPLSEQTKKKISDSKKGRTNGNREKWKIYFKLRVNNE